MGEALRVPMNPQRTGGPSAEGKQTPSMEVISVKTTRTAAIVAAAAAALAGTSYAATVGVQQVLRSSSRATVEPPSLYQGTAGNDQLHGSAGPDTILGGAGNDHLYGGDGNDILEGGAGNDVIAGGQGHDTMDGGPGNDVIFSRDGCRDVIDGGPGIDTAIVDQLDVVRNVEHVQRAYHAPTCS
jgi:Ca2+-binding RTX toxin-like protein